MNNNAKIAMPEKDEVNIIPLPGRSKDILIQLGSNIAFLLYSVGGGWGLWRRPYLTLYTDQC